ncbi:MAG: ribonuclease H-like domain-containing protein [Lachnospiraceae bacterium]
MKTITKEFPRGEIYPVESLTKGYTPILFDIETTGLKAETSYLYLIGALEIKRDRLNFIQWFAEKPSEELEVLDRFLAWLPDKACLIHFNGRGFDVPYLCKKCRQYDIPARLSQMPNIDLYRSFSPLKDYFQMASRRLVAYEQLIGLNREDCYNGGELIDVYKEYIGKSKFDGESAEKLLNMLLLHNEEDISDMVPVLSLFSYTDLFSGNFESYNINHKFNDDAGNDCSSGTLTITLQAFHSYPLKHEKILATMPCIENIIVKTHGDTAEIQIPVIKERLRHFYDDFKNYYYLPAEDTAVHKSVASCVDSEHRISATKATAYTWATGQFIPQISKAIKPDFKRELCDPVSFIPIDSLKKEDNLRMYIRGLF